MLMLIAASHELVWRKSGAHLVGAGFYKERLSHSLDEYKTHLSRGSPFGRQHTTKEEKKKKRKKRARHNRASGFAYLVVIVAVAAEQRLHHLLPAGNTPL